MGAVSGTLSHASRVVVIREDTWVVEATTTAGAGEYSITGLDLGSTKLIVARRDDNGQSLSYGNVTAYDNWTPHTDEVLYLNFEQAGTITDLSSSNNSSWSVIPSGDFSNVIVSDQAKYGSQSLRGAGTRGIKHALTSSLSFGTADFTAQCWFYPRSDQPGQANGYVPIFGGENYDKTIMFYRTDQGNKLHMYESGGGAICNTGLTINDWNHIRLVRQSGKYYVFLNGTLDSPGAGFNSVRNLTTDWTNGLHLLIEPNSSRECNGYIDSFQMIESSVGISNFTPEERSGVA